MDALSGPPSGHRPTLGGATRSHTVPPRSARLPERITPLLIDSTSPEWSHPIHPDPATSPSWS